MTLFDYSSVEFCLSHCFLCRPNGTASMFTHSIRLQSWSWSVIFFVFSGLSAEEGRSSGLWVLRTRIEMDADAFACYMADNHCVHLTGSSWPRIFNRGKCNICSYCHGPGFELYHTYLFVRISLSLLCDIVPSFLLQTSCVRKPSRSPI